MSIHQAESTLFLQSLKQAGVEIHNEGEVIERLAEAREWRFAFSTLATQGKRIGIWFAATAKVHSKQLKNLFVKFNFTDRDEAAFEAAMQA